MTQQVDVLFQTDTVRIEEFHCDGGPNAHISEEYALEHEIVFPRSGAFVRRNAAGTTVADPTQIIFFQRDQGYEISHPIGGGDCSTVFVLAPMVLADMLRMIDLSSQDRPDAPFPIAHALADTQHRITQICLLRAARNEFADALAIEEQILMLLGGVIRHAYHVADKPPQSARNATRREHADIANQTALVLAEHYCEKLSLSAVASTVSASPYFLCRVFRQQTGLSIHQYLLRMRLLYALEQLAENPREDLTTLALSLGFSSHSHFSSAFVSAFGISPSQFRAGISVHHLREMSRILTV